MNMRFFKASLLTMLFFTLACLTVFSQEQNNRIAEISNGGSGVNWLIKVPYQSATLTVSAPNGKVFSREFIAGSIPSFFSGR